MCALDTQGPADLDRSQILKCQKLKIVKTALKHDLFQNKVCQGHPASSGMSSVFIVNEPRFSLNGMMIDA